MEQELILRIERGIEDHVEGEAVLLRKVRQQGARQRRLAGADIAEDERQSPPQADGDFQPRERLHVRVGAEEKGRIRARGERFFRQPQRRVVTHQPVPRSPFPALRSNWISPKPFFCFRRTRMLASRSTVVSSKYRNRVSGLRPTS